MTLVSWSCEILMNLPMFYAKLYKKRCITNMLSFRSTKPNLHFITVTWTYFIEHVIITLLNWIFFAYGMTSLFHFLQRDLIEPSWCSVERTNHYDYKLLLFFFFYIRSHSWFYHTYNIILYVIWFMNSRRWLDTPTIKLSIRLGS